jgi:hypothetical protein
MNAIITIGQIAGPLLVSICAALGIEWVFLTVAFRLMSGAVARTAARPPLSQARSSVARISSFKCD